jgi:hypothetical protein
MLFGEGFSAEADQFEELLEKGLIEKKGNTFLFMGAKIGVGKAKAREWIKDNQTTIQETLTP